MATLWVDTRVSDNVAISGQFITSLMTGVSATETRFTGMTLLRTIIGMSVGAFTHDSGEGSAGVDIGIGVTSQEAFAANQLPDPETETDFPTRGWIWRSAYRTFAFAADQPAVYEHRIDLDLRSRRKLENGECYLIASNLTIEGVGHVVRLTGYIRQLWLMK